MGQQTPQATSEPGGPARTGQAHAHALAFLIIVIISTSFPLGEHITHGLDPAVMMCLRFVLAALLMAPIVAWREGLRLPGARSFVRYLALGAPLAFFLMNRWLQDFAVRVEMSWGTFLMVGLAALGIAWLTVGYHAIRAALADPVKALRYE